jgi:hypothetical protein
MCAAMLDGRYWTVGELARCAGVATPAAGEHLAQLVAGRVIEAVTAGRHRYFRLGGPDAAAARQALALASPAISGRTSRQGHVSQALRAGRTCYDHLAGQLGVRMTESLIGHGVITAGFGPGDLSPLAPLELNLPAAASRPLIRACVDWTERRQHAAGLLPAAMTRRMLELGWLSRTSQPRVVTLTDSGRAALADLLPDPSC